jgi:acetyl-CoA carboxylase biotin carboxyl carrier protein
LPPPKSSASSHPPLKCPMAGTFYRSPGPGEPAFVKACIRLCLYKQLI